MDVDMDYIDSNYIWQRRILSVFRKCKTSVPFPYAAAIGVEYNPTFERHDKIDVELLTNGAILDINDFLTAVTKSAPFYLLDILIFNFSLGLDADSPLFYNYASKVYAYAKSLKNEIKTRPLQLQEKMQDVFLLPDLTLQNTDFLLQKSELKISSALHLDDERKGDPIILNKIAGKTVQITMDSYPLCKKGGVNFVLRPSNAPLAKLSPTLLTGGMILEMLNFTRILTGVHCRMLKKLISHNFGEVYEPSYLSREVRLLFEKKLSISTRELRESLYKEKFKFKTKFIRRKLKETEIHKRPQDLDSDVEFVPEKRKPEVSRSNDDYVCQDEEINEASYMCPMEFEPDIPTNADPENEQNKDVLVDVESDVPEVFTVRKKEKCARSKKRQGPRYLGFQYMRRQKNTAAFSNSEIFCEDTLPMHQKTVKQKEWTRRTNRIKEIFNKVQNLVCRCRDIGVDFNVGSGQKQNLDMNLITNQTLYEINRFSVHLSKSVSVFVMDIMESNFNLLFRDEVRERNFMSYILGKERILCIQAHKQALMSTTITFPDGYNVMNLTTNDKELSDDVSDEDLSDEFPYCKDINLNLWSLEERPPNRKLDLAVLTHGALLEILTFARRLASNPRDLLNDVLEHNFDVDLEDPTTEDTLGMNKWFDINKMQLKKPLVTLKANMWLTEEINLKQYSLLKQPQLITEVVTPVPVQKVQEYTYEICKEIGLDLNVSRNSPSKPKLDMHLLTRGALFEVHNFVKTRCNRYVPALYEILDYNFDLSSQRHRRVELAWSIAAQVLAMVRKGERKGRYMQQVFELPFESKEGEVCKEEPEEREIEETESRCDDLVFVQKLIPVDIDIEIE